MRSTSMRCLTMAGVLAAAAGETLRAQQFAPNPKVDKIFAQWDRADSPGCALGVLQNSRFVYQRGYGMANLDYDIPNSPRMVYYVGSDSKQFTGAAIGLLALDGKLSLDDDIRKYVPEMPDYGTPITIRQAYMSAVTVGKSGPEVEKTDVARKEIDALWDAIKKLLTEKVA